MSHSDVGAARELLERLAVREDRAAADHQKAAGIGRTHEGVATVQWFTDHANERQAQAALLWSLASSLSGIADMKRDAERLDWLEGEMVRETDGHYHERTASLFRRNVPITRASIDAARLASDSGTERTS